MINNGNDQAEKLRQLVQNNKNNNTETKPEENSNNQNTETKTEEIKNTNDQATRLREIMKNKQNNTNESFNYLEYLEEGFLYESTEEFLLDEGAVKDFVDRQIDKINGLTKIGLKREDLYDPAKVKAAIKKMEPLKDQNKKLVAKAIASLFVIFINFIIGMIVIQKGSEALSNDIDNSTINYIGDTIANSFNASGLATNATFEHLPTDTHKKWDAAFVGVMGVFIGNMIFDIVGLRTEYDKIMSAFDKTINKIDKLIKEENKKEVHNKDYIKDLEKKKKKLIEGKTAVYEKYKKEAAELNNVKEL